MLAEVMDFIDFTSSVFFLTKKKERISLQTLAVLFAKFRV